MARCVWGALTNLELQVRYDSESLSITKQAANVSGAQTCSQIKSEVYWQLDARQISFGGMKLCQRDCHLLLDSGTRSILVPQIVLNYIHKVQN